MANKILKIIYALLLVCFIISIFQIKRLPEKAEVNPALLQEPIQSASERKDFGFSYRGKRYDVRPQAEYELWGLVVSVNNIGAWYNFYHDENSVNLKDVCVVWGDNIANGVYRDQSVKIKSGEWTCYFQWGGAMKEKFYPNKLSNNHLLASDEKVQEAIRGVRVGDQLHLKGALADYAESGTNQFRMTSLTRDDDNHSSRGNGACKIFYVDDIQIFQRNQAAWHAVNFWSIRVLLGLMVAQFMIFLIASLKFVKKLRREN